jgi:hypothetical protein
VRRLTGAVLVAVAAAACSSGDGDAALTLDDLRDAGDDCPVDLAGTDLVADEVGPIEVEVTEGSGDGDAGDSAIDQAGGVYVECRTGGDAGTRAVVYASEQPNAFSILLPQAAQDLGLAADDLQVLLGAYDDAGSGDLVELGAEGPVAAARIDVDGAESAVLYLSTDDASPEEVEDTVEELVDQL